MLSHKDSETLMRLAQEQALLHEVELNRDAYTILNMRGVTKKGKITRYVFSYARLRKMVIVNLFTEMAIEALRGVIFGMSR